MLSIQNPDRSPRTHCPFSAPFSPTLARRPVSPAPATRSPLLCLAPGPLSYLWSSPPFLRSPVSNSDHRAAISHPSTAVLIHIAAISLTPSVLESFPALPADPSPEPVPGNSNDRAQALHSGEIPHSCKRDGRQTRPQGAGPGGEDGEAPQKTRTGVDTQQLLTR